MQDCQYAGNSCETCESAEDSQDNEPANQLFIFLWIIRLLHFN